MDTLQETQSQTLLCFNLNSSIIDAFIKSQDIRETSKNTYRKGLNHFLKWLEQCKISQPNRNTILEYKSHLKDYYSNSTTSTYLTCIRTFFVWLNSVTGYPVITAGIKNPRSAQHGALKDALTAQQAKEVIIHQETKTTAQKRDLAILELMTLTGLRTIEVVRANIEDIRTLDGVKVLYIQGKGRDAKDEFVKLPHSVILAINNYLTSRSTSQTLKQSDPLFVSVSNHNNNDRLTTRSISRIVKNALIKAGYKSDRLTAHSLRHTAVTLAIKGGANLRDVQQMARHTSIATTERYAHDLRRLNNSAEDVIEAMLLAS